MNENLDLLNDWHRRSRESQHAHFESAKYLSRYNYYLGVPVVFLTSITGTSIFATLESEPEILFKVLVGVISVFSAILAGLQTFLRYSERSEKHKIAGAKYGALRREIEFLRTTKSVKEQALKSMMSRLNQLSTESPEISEKIWKKVEKNLQGSEG